MSDSDVYVSGRILSDAKIRSDAILLFGVNEMSTKDVFEYFQGYMPGSIEWIDDISCVVVWEDENSTKRAFANLGTKFTPAEDSRMCEDEQLENIWRIGVKHPKSKQLLMRYATTADKKIKGAGSRSLYYLIHGHPESQKRKASRRGLVSSSRRRKINADQNRIKTELDQGPEVEIFNQDSDDSMGRFEDEMDIDEPPVKVLISEGMSRGSTPDGNLYADQQRHTSIRSRLSKPSDSVLRKKHMNDLPNSAKMDEELSKSNIRGGRNSDVSDLRQKLKNRKHRFDKKTRPSLSIEITED
ncbi:nuclear cap-binding protein subunit 3-like isoform X2 [Dendronephthya gigantea]|uniref:nuclear cap-binding protein subunit 3-like isoform X2 n=1 Tax=Dendronephthya gigantea TaxID=151771 RepID=UPI0010695391|nr:nuclear cap-binding protein subunit 3-like isoform X2 [Dendronephthya gigantea]